MLMMPQKVLNAFSLDKILGSYEMGWGELRQFNVKQQTKITNRLAFAICNFVGNVDSTTDGYTSWRVGLTNWSDATPHASVWRTPIGLSQF